jgi:hypothetical protein
MKPRSSVLALASIAALATLAAASGCASPTNPPITAQPKWVNKDVEAFARRACFDCHSNETKWPFYAGLPFAASLIKKDVEEGREALNFSEWDRQQEEVDELGEVVLEGEMPLAIYVPLHPGARLSEEEKRTLARGLDATVRADPPPGGGGDD